MADVVVDVVADVAVADAEADAEAGVGGAEDAAAAAEGAEDAAGDMQTRQCYHHSFSHENTTHWPSTSRRSSAQAEKKANTSSTLSAAMKKMPRPL